MIYESILLAFIILLVLIKHFLVKKNKINGILFPYLIVIMICVIYLFLPSSMHEKIVDNPINAMYFDIVAYVLIIYSCIVIFDNILPFKKK